MMSNARQPVWDIFCTVIDNFGDIGVCWRLARQLANEYALTVRLWVDDLNAFQRICSDINPQSATQSISGVEVRAWSLEFNETTPGDVVIEAFACHLPEPFVAAMAASKKRPVWINLDYLSAESWVAGCHALPSPHPRLPLTKYFFFPGFDEHTGGLLREADLQERKTAFCTSPEQQADFWRMLLVPPPAADRLKVSLFAYENPALNPLLEIWSRGTTPVCCLAPETRTLPAIEAFAGRRLRAGDVVQRGNLEILILPFVSQTDYDKLLWLCDMNFVRGEDSFVRAQWAAKPMLWHIYPQDEEAHQIKLSAFLDIYCLGLSGATEKAIRDLFQLWNSTQGGEQLMSEVWHQWARSLPQIRQHSEDWANNLLKQEDLCSSLVRFCRSKL
ncbi:MAG: elongation factor P maturation arginine rhamnosyltransferase EarP [Betaproteobacteria bacterium]